MSALRRLAAGLAVVAALSGTAVAASAVGRDVAAEGAERWDGPAAAWSPPSTTAPPATTAVVTTVPVLPTLAPARAPFSSYFTGTLRVRNIAARSLGVGTAFVVGDGTWALTNRHVVADAQRLELETWDGQPRGEAQVVAIGPATTDLALLRLPTALPGALHLATKTASLFSDLTAGGYPEAEQFTRSEGELLAVTTQGGMQMLVTNVPAAPGSSGSPLLNRDGLVVGVIFGGSAAGYTLAVPAADAVALLATQQLQP